MTTRQNEKIKAIVDNYKPDQQIDIALEECAELSKALLKYRRKYNSDTGTAEEVMKLREDIIDELADVEIMVEQMIVIFGCSFEVDNRVNFKINRQLQRIREKGGNNRVHTQSGQSENNKP